MTISKFDGHKNANAYHIDYEFTGREALQSYNTIVIESIYDYANKRLRHIIHGLYSATTRKHIGWYAKVQCLEYSDFKWAYEHNCDIIQDYETGEIIFESRETGEILKIIEKN